MVKSTAWLAPVWFANDRNMCWLQDILRYFDTSQLTCVSYYQLVCDFEHDTTNETMISLHCKLAEECDQ